MSSRAGSRRTRISRSENMRRIRGTNTGPERTVKRILRRIGIPFRQNYRVLPGKPDFAFLSRRKVTFVHGCFWHQHKNCVDSHLPKTNRSYWRTKLSRNKKRDSLRKRALTKAGWSYLVIWECELKDERRVTRALSRFLTRKRGQRNQGTETKQRTPGEPRIQRTSRRPAT